MSPPKRFQETKIEKSGVTSRDCAFPEFTCSECKATFVFEGYEEDANGAIAPQFCPHCGRKRADA